MDSGQQALWSRIESLEIDDPASALPFSVRLARENGWSLRFALRALAEYRRFVFLASTAGHAVCPSEEVDAVWHLHLCYTRSYWHDLCRDTLGKPLHHEPTRGGSSQLNYHRSMYEETLAAYRSFFKQEPPADIWPATDERFAQGGRERHVNTAEHWIIPKPSLKPIKQSIQLRTKQWLWVAGLGLFPLFGAITNPLEMRGPEFLTFYFWLACIAIAAGIVLRIVFRQGDSGGRMPELDMYEIATLAGGTNQATTLAVTDLDMTEAVQLEGTTKPRLIRSSGTPAKHPLPQAIYQIVDKESNCTLLDAHANSVLEAEKIAARLESDGLLESDASFTASRWLPVLLVGGVLLLGLAKIAVGLSREKPVAFLVILCVGVVIALWKFYQRPLRTKRGDRVLDHLKKEYHETNTDLEEDGTLTYQLLGMSLFGLASMAAAGGLATEVYNSLKPTVTSTWSGSGCSAGCGGGGCGGGGGGCGGGCGGCGGD